MSASVIGAAARVPRNQSFDALSHLVIYCNVDIDGYCVYVARTRVASGSYSIALSMLCGQVR